MTTSTLTPGDLEERLSLFRNAVLVTPTFRTQPATVVSPGSRHVSFLVDEHWEVTREMQHSGRVVVVMGDDDSCLSLVGRARVEEDLPKTRALRTPEAELWLDGAKNTALRILHVDVEHADYWRVRQTALLRFAWRLVHHPDRDEPPPSAHEALS